ncbi:FHA domain-containing protein [Amycolatopsis nigrescens]|uniref:FHA domain-containing protein n=1 Tax=Amycolatopsis nigrescens TaxID=381445 RepID=UPI000370C094|nr:FHA domain-containing protein [Amycolatopsis nigrescens]
MSNEHDPQHAALHEHQPTSAIAPPPVGDAPSPPPVLPPDARGTGLLVIVRGPGVGTRFPLSDGTITIGRHAECDIRLDDLTVSRQHAELHRKGDGLELVDLGSLNSTYVNRLPVDRVTINPGDEIWIGKFRLAYLA